MRTIGLAVIGLVLLGTEANAKSLAGTYEITKTKLWRTKAYTGKVGLVKRGPTYVMSYKTSRGSWGGIALVAGKRLWAATGKRCGLYLIRASAKGWSGTHAEASAPGRTGRVRISKLGKVSGTTPTGRRYKGELVSHQHGEEVTSAREDAIAINVAGVDRTGMLLRIKNTVGVALGCKLISFRIKGKRLLGHVANADQDKMSPKPDMEQLRRVGPPPRGLGAAGLVHRGGGVSVTLPSGWKVGNRPGRYNAPKVLAGYTDNISITITNPFAVTRKNAKQLIKVFVSQLRKSAPDYRMTTGKMLKLSGHTALRIAGTVTIKGHRIVIDQAVVATPRAGVLINCNYPVKRERTTGKLCRAAFDSVR